MWAYHYQLERFRISHTAGKQILCDVNLELVYENATQLPSFLLAEGGILGNLSDLLV